MPTCCRCGKNLSTQQALQYHYNKKFKCNFAWKCEICDTVFQTQAQFNAHSKVCNPEKNHTYEFLRTHSGSDTYLLNESQKIINNSDGSLNGKLYTSTLHPNLHERITFEISKGCTRELVKTLKGEIKFISVLKTPTGYILDESKSDVHKFKTVGSLTPPAEVVSRM